MANCAARPEKSVVITSEVKTLPVFTLCPEMAFKFSTLSWFPIPKVKILLPAVLAMLALPTAALRAVDSLAPQPCPLIMVFGFPSDAKRIRSGLSALPPKVLLALKMPSSQLVQLPPPAELILVLTAVKSEVKPCKTLAVVSN